MPVLRRLSGAQVSPETLRQRGIQAGLGVRLLRCRFRAARLAPTAEQVRAQQVGETSRVVAAPGA